MLINVKSLPYEGFCRTKKFKIPIEFCIILFNFLSQTYAGIRLVEIPILFHTLMVIIAKITCAR